MPKGIFYVQYNLSWKKNLCFRILAKFILAFRGIARKRKL
jgi:hypothetical protein